ncbi:GtrA family protein [Taibaiella koreensis]|uniref:GtrA family protein n=1 Tax=Taibaiella koreensis TaxID=1268548 RepID=UPI0013C35EBE|nr:GtrA family protein [Taibaiella koreensis]
MRTFLKAQASSLIATGVDFGVTFICKQLLGWFFAASVIGNICGGITNFLLGRNWVFSSKTNKAGWQALKYIVVWAGNLLLNAGGVYVFTEIIKLEDWISKIIISLLVGIGYNYVLQKFFVFRKQQEHGA